MTLSPSASETSPPAPTPALPPADRALLLDWLAGLLAREPDAETVGLLTGEGGDRMVADLADYPGLDREAEALVSALRAVRAEEGTDERTALALAGTFGTLFLGAGTKSKVAHPYASVYRDGGRTHGAATDRAAAFLARNGLDLAEGVTELADHVGVLLAALAVLAEREADALEEGDQSRAAACAAEQALFTAEEMIPWFPLFRQRVEAGDPRGFHAAVARLVDLVLKGMVPG
ncbi:MAG: molecular chaperone TorD family protein [Rhodospirillum sp.]|nr:molecular chaperone TorD family protein [Rhodospirillum sp.]